MISKEQIEKAMSLTPCELDQVLLNSGYGIDSPTQKVKFKGLNDDGSFVYDTKFKDLDGNPISAPIFISYSGNKLVAEY